MQTDDGPCLPPSKDADPEVHDALISGFWSSLTWRPISEFEAAGVDLVMLRGGEQWAFGFRGPGWEEGDDLVTWRDAQESMDCQPLAFEPETFATVSDEWRVHLIAD